MDEISGIYRHGLKMALRKLSYRAQGICARVRRHAMRRIDEAFIALGLMKEKSPLFEVKILDSQVEGFGDSQSAAIEQVDDKPGWVAVQV